MPGPLYSNGLRSVAIALLVLCTGAMAPAGAPAAPPPNDVPLAAAAFEAYGAANGRPRDLQAVAELAEATADPGVPRCLGPRSFARTAWFRLPAAPTAQEVVVDAIGRTLAVLDVAAFVQPAGSDGVSTAVPNTCSGAGSGGSAAAEEATSGVVLRVAAGRAVLVQVGRRGAIGSLDDERALLSLDARPLAPEPAPAGDAAGAATPFLLARRTNVVPLAGATLGDEDPAQPACSAPGSVWRRIVPGGDGARLIEVKGRAARTLTVFSGTRPTDVNARDCVVRAGYGTLRMRVRAKRRQPLWIRIGTARPAPGSAATLRVSDGARETVVDGGSGGFDPTAGGPGGGLPASCERARASRARVRGPRFSPQTGRRGSLRIAVSVRRSAICDVRLRLIGPRGHTYARARAIRLSGRRVVRLLRVRGFVRGRYRLRVDAASELGGRTPVPAAVKGRRR
jgi:hypothetical protein